MKILIEMTEEEYDEYRTYLEEKDVVDINIEDLKEAYVTETLKKVVENSQFIDGLRNKPKVLDEVSGSFSRVKHARNK